MRSFQDASFKRQHSLFQAQKVTFGGACRRNGARAQARNPVVAKRLAAPPPVRERL